jgi:hypothetical protein
VHQGPRSDIVALIATVLIAPVLWYVMRFLARGRSTAPTLLVLAATYVLICARTLAASDLQPNTERDSQSWAWRSGTHDAANALYLLLKVYGAAGADYKVLSDELLPTASHPISMLDIEHAATARGLPAHIVAVNPSGLRARVPGIVWLKPIRDEQGGFYLVIDIDDTRVRLISGAHLVWFELPKESFCDAWSGHVLFFRREKTTSLVYGAAVFVVPMTLCSLYLGVRRWRLRTRHTGKARQHATELH